MRTPNTRDRLAVVTILSALILGLGGTAVAEEPANFAEALARAEQSGQPLVLDFFTEW